MSNPVWGHGYHQGFAEGISEGVSKARKEDILYASLALLMYRAWNSEKGQKIIAGAKAKLPFGKKSQTEDIDSTQAD